MAETSDPARSLLVIVETPEAALPALDWPGILGETAGLDYAVVLAFADAPLEDPLEALRDRGVRAEIVDCADLLVAAMRGEIPGFRQILAQLVRVTNEDPDFWLTKLSEVNFTRPLWFELVRLTVVVDTLDSRGFARCVSVAGADFAALVGRLLMARGIGHTAAPIGARRVGGPLIPIRVLGKLLLNVGRELRAWTAARRLPAVRPAKVLAYADYPDNWHEAEQPPHSRMTGRLSEVAPQDAGLSYCISVSRRNQPMLRRGREIVENAARAATFRPDLPVVVVERCASLRDLLRCHLRPASHFRWMRRAWAVGRRGAVVYRGIDIGDRLREAVLDAGLVDIPKNSYFETCLRRLLAATGARKVIAPLFELAEGRAVLRAANRSGARTIAMQHGSVGLGHRWRFSLVAGVLAGAGRPGAETSPQAIAVEGHPAAGWLREDGFPEPRIAAVGAPRLANPLPPYDPDDIGTSVLVLGDLHFWPAMFRWCLSHLAERGFHLVLRSHPLARERVRGWFQRETASGRENIVLSDTGIGLDAELRRTKPFALVVSATGAGLDAALAGWPVGIRRSNWLPDGNPLSVAGDDAVFASADATRFRDWLTRLHRDRGYRCAYGERCRRGASELVAETGREAAARLIRLVAADGDTG